MAKKLTPIDAIFKEKLIDYQVVPSSEAWQKIEANLPSKSRSLKIYWWAAAASISGILIATFLLNSNSKNPISENQLTTIRLDEMTKEIEPKPDRSDFKQAENPTQMTQKRTSIPEKKIEKMVEKRLRRELSQIEPEINIQLVILDVDPILMPVENLELNRQIRETNEQTEIPTSESISLNIEEEPLYRVNIYSNGIKKENSPKNLLTELHKTANQVENILDKVDDGLSIQKIKTSLMQTLASKKEKLSERP